MKIHSQWENVRVYRGIALICVYTTCMAPSIYLCQTMKRNVEAVI